MAIVANDAAVAPLREMTMRRALSAVVLLCAASGAMSYARAERGEDIAIKFALVAGKQAVSCDAPLKLGTPAVKALLREARVYIYDIKLIDGQGGRVPLKLDRNDWQYADVALLDFEGARGERASCSEPQPPKNAVIKGNIPAGRYSGLEFSVGVPVEREVDGKKVSLNHSDMHASPPPLDIARMSWSWRAGRRYLVVEVDPEGGIKRPDGAQSRTWMVHLGATGCNGNPATGEIVACARPNRFAVKFERFDYRNEEIAIDLLALFKDSDLSRNESGAIGCMSDPADPECGKLFTTLGLSATDAPGAGNAEPQAIPGTSSIFRVQSKP
jgi:uncharacterized repeat protein (TIGR04052 family)